MPELSIPVVNRSPFELPAYATPGSSGMDLRAFLPEKIILQPMQRALIPTGLYIELPEGFEAQVRPRSGLALRKGLTCLNSPGTIDADYRGEIGVIIVNLSGEIQDIDPGERVAQLVIQKIEKAAWNNTQSISETSRNAGGFGHTGTH